MKYKLYWTSKNKQSSLDMGEYSSYHEAEKAIPSAKAEMENQNNGPADWIANGSWEVSPETP